MQKELWNQALIARDDLDTAQAAVDASQAALEAQQAQVDSANARYKADEQRLSQAHASLTKPKSTWSIPSSPARFPAPSFHATLTAARPWRLVFVADSVYDWRRFDQDAGQHQYR